MLLKGRKIIVLVYVEDVMVTRDYFTLESLIGHIKGKAKIQESACWQVG